MTRSPVALVTGGRRGIGRGIAYALADRGYDVVISDIVDDEATHETLDGVTQRGRRVAWIAHDIAEIERHAAFVDRVWDTFGTLDCLVNNAGVQVKVRGDILDVTPESFDRLIGINLRGTFFLTQAVSRRMLTETRATGDPPRAIVTISSANARIVGQNRAEYCMSKTALAMMNQLFAYRLADADVMCYEIRPGIIRTEMTAGAAAKYDPLIAAGISPVRRWGEPEDVGRTVAALASRQLPFSTGDAFHVDGGFHMKEL